MTHNHPLNPNIPKKINNQLKNKKQKPPNKLNPLQGTKFHFESRNLTTKPFSEKNPFDKNNQN